VRDAIQPMKVVFADDEPLSRATMRKLLARDPEVEVVAECANGIEAVGAVRSERPDILILDIQMPGMTGFEVVEELEDEGPPVIVFATAYDQYALDAFEVHAVDYLLKPFDDERFQKALERAKLRAERESRSAVGEQLSGLLETLNEGRSAAGSSNPALTRLTIHREGRVDVVNTEDLVWIESADQYVMLHTADGEFLMREAMSKLEQSLDAERFLRIHRSAIVALDQVRTLERLGSGVGRVQLVDGQWLPVARSRMAALKGRLG
jgi:two-component system LytT family response regulator